MSTKFQDMIGKVRGLLANADDPATTPEAAAMYRDKADALIFKYKIDLASAPAEERVGTGYAKPEWRDIFFCALGNEWRNYYSGIALAIVAHVDARCVTLRKADGYYLRVVGFGADLDYIEMLLASATLAFGKRMEPTVNKDETETANAYRLRMGGMERHRIATALWGPQEHTMDPAMSRWESGYDEAKKAETNEFKARNRRVTNLIKKGAVEAGENPDVVLGRGNSIKTFRESYAGGFYWTLRNRLMNLGLSRGETDKGLVLASLERQVEEEFYGAYPHLKPSETGRDDYVPPNRGCDKCKKAKAGYCRDHMYLKPSTAKPKHSAYNDHASSLGSAAARTVDLGPGGTPKAPSGATRTELG